MIRSTSRSLALALPMVLSLVGLAGCSVDTGETVDVEAVQSAATLSPETFVAQVSARRAYVGTPTYGYEPTAPFVTFRLSVEDTLVRAAHPSFDGYERPFALVPLGSADAPRWERIDLPYRGEGRRGYYAERRVDHYEVAGRRIGEGDLAAIERFGVAFGMETNVGTIWAQRSGDNTRLVFDRW